MSATYDAVLLDADDTLFDFHRCERYALDRTFSEFGIGLPVDAYIQDFREINAAVWREYETGESTPEVIRTRRFVQLLDRLRVAVDPLPVSDRYIHHLSQAAFLVDGAIELLERLHGRIPMVLLTNGLSVVQRSRFAKAGVNGYFAGIVISEEVGVQKPEPAVFRIALSYVSGKGGTAAGRDDTPHAIMIGDNLHSDVQGALEAGLDACWFNLRNRLPDPDVTPTYTVRSLEEIPAVLGL